MSNVKGSTEIALCYRVPLPGPFYYSGRVGSKHWFPSGSRSGSGPMGFVVKWFIIYPSIAIFGAGLAIMLAPFYGLFWVVRRSLRNWRGVPAGCSVFPCSAASAAAAGSEPRLEAVRFRPGPAGARGW